MPLLTWEQEEQLKEAQRQAKVELWRRGNLNYLRHSTQRAIKAAVEKGDHRQFFMLCSRRTGKSTEALIRQVETCIQKPGARCLVIGPFAKDMANIANDLAVDVLRDCPPELRPKYNAVEKEFVFPNDSRIRLKGANGEHARFLRGGAADEVFLDECGEIDNLDFVLNSVVLPMTLTTQGRILMAMTPPPTPGHESVPIYNRLADAGAAVVFTLRDSPHIPHNEKCRMLVAVGESPDRVEGILSGELEAETTTARREFFCLIETDASRAVIPEFTRALQKKIVVPHIRPEYFDAYVSMDAGMADNTGLLFAYTDFLQDKIIIEDEALLVRANTATIAKTIFEKERVLWGDKTPYMRVSDVDLRLIADLWDMHRIQFAATEKHDRQVYVNLLRNLLASGKIIIDPRCVKLTRQLEQAIWNRKLTDFDRPGEKSLDGHWDLLAACIYLTRNIQRGHNPYPAGHFAPPPHVFVSPKTRYARENQMDLGLLKGTPTGERVLAAHKKKWRGY